MFPLTHRLLISEDIRNGKNISIDHDRQSCAPPSPQRSRPSVKLFDFCKDCGDASMLVIHPSRYRPISVCTTADHGPKSKTFKETIIGICEERRDKRSKEVSVRLHGAISDLHAVDAHYHRVCYKEFVESEISNIACCKTKDQAMMLTEIHLSVVL